jgi:hypothetical protein
MKAHELLNSAEAWCQESPAEDWQGNKLQALDPRAVKWCVLGAIQRAYPVSQWGEAMDRLLRALSVSERGLAQMNKSDKACSLMEWNAMLEARFWMSGKFFYSPISEDLGGSTISRTKTYAKPVFEMELAEILPLDVTLRGKFPNHRVANQNW